MWIKPSCKASMMHPWLRLAPNQDGLALHRQGSNGGDCIVPVIPQRHQNNGMGALSFAPAWHFCVADDSSGEAAMHACCLFDEFSGLKSGCPHHPAWLVLPCFSPCHWHGSAWLWILTKETQSQTSWILTPLNSSPRPAAH